MKVANLISNALNMHMFSQPEFRQGIRITGEEKSFEQLLKAGLEKASKFLANLKPSSILPYSMHVPRFFNVNLDEVTIDKEAASFKTYKYVDAGEVLTVSELFIITDLLQLPQSEKRKPNEVGRYAVNGLFGTEEFESIVRSNLTTKRESTKKLCDMIIKA